MVKILILRTFILITIEFSRFHTMYFPVIKTITSGPARNSHTRWVYLYYRSIRWIFLSGNSHFFLRNIFCYSL